MKAMIDKKDSQVTLASFHARLGIGMHRCLLCWCKFFYWTGIDLNVGVNVCIAFVTASADAACFGFASILPLL